MTDEQMITGQIARLRTRLVDLSLRNRFLNFRLSRRYGLEIIQANVDEVYKALVVDGKKCVFASAEPSLFPEASPDEHASANASLGRKRYYVLHTQENEKGLKQRLLQTYRQARSIMEEQGINTLFIALGMLTWQELDSSTEYRMAPLILIPVLIEREEQETYSISYEGSEVVSNLSLIQKLQVEFGIQIKEPQEFLRAQAGTEADESDLNLNAYFNHIQQAVRCRREWSVEKDKAVLSFFNYTKYVMYKDLDIARWSTSYLCSHKPLTQVFGGLVEDDAQSTIPHDLDQERPVSHSYEVFDADSSQICAVLAAKEFDLVLVEGPPGTGKSQTITNLIAEYIFAGKKVLFVAEKRAALEVVWRRLEEAGMSEACLELHSGKTSKAEFYASLKKTIDTAAPQARKDLQAELEQLETTRRRLNEFYHALHMPLPQRGISPRKVLDALCQLGIGKADSDRIWFEWMRTWDYSTFMRARNIVVKIAEFVQRHGAPGQLGFWGSQLEALLPDLYDSLRRCIGETRLLLSELSQRAQAVDDLGLDFENIRQTILAREQTWRGHIDRFEQSVQPCTHWSQRMSVRRWMDLRLLHRLLRQQSRLSETQLRSIVEMARSLLHTQASLRELLRLLQADASLSGLENASLQQQLTVVQKWYEDRDLSLLEKVVQFNLLLKEAEQNGLGTCIRLAIDDETAAEWLVPEFELTYYRGLWREACQLRPVLRDYDSESMRSLVQNFAEQDQYLLKINRLRVKLKHFEGIPRYKAEGGGLEKINREMFKSRRHKPIRRIMAEAGEAIQAIKPVFMMSPLSVALYLPPDSVRFDLVIFDEASQVKPEDAVGAILRGNRLVVVGDSKQLPPTTFFDRIMDDDTANENSIDAYYDLSEGMESILDMVNAALPPASPRRQRLRWHYRSKHESLIACSNYLFYDNDLVVPPSAHKHEPVLGLHFHHLPQTTYDRGGTRKNLEEARIVAEAVKEHVRSTPELSLGVVAFSVAQQEAIEDAIELLRRSDPQFESDLHLFEGHHPFEPLFVKNLETVQGDERDVILISVGYGRDKDGYLSAHFGPLNQQGGERRLNVLITRARYRCEVFSNITYQDVPEDAQARGVQALRTFLKFAQTGEIEPETHRGEPTNPFEESVKKAIEELGYEVHCQVGSAHFYIDLGVVHPKDHNHYLLGVECDGAPYHSSRTARERDRLRQQVLEQRGWRIHRVWSTSWYRENARERAELKEAIERALIASDTKHSHQAELRSGKVADIQQIDVQHEVNAQNNTEMKLPAYTITQLNIKPHHRRIAIRDIPPDELARYVAQVVQTESPVHVEQVLARIAQAFGAQRVGSAMRHTILSAVSWLTHQRAVVVDGDFLLRDNRGSCTARDWSHLPPEARQIQYVYPREIADAVLKAVDAYFGLSREEAVRLSLRLLGFGKVGQKARPVVESVIAHLLQTGELVERSGVLRRP